MTDKPAACDRCRRRDRTAFLWMQHGGTNPRIPFVLVWRCFRCQRFFAPV